jgi:hypothetical protein
MKHIAYLMLDEALGEYDVETKIGLIQMLPRETPPSMKRYPLSKLAELFDELASRLASPGAPN